MQVWEELMGVLEDGHELGLMTVYQAAKVLSFEKDCLVVGFPADGLTAEIATDKAKIDRMRELMGAHFGRPIGFQVRQLSAGEEAQAVSVIEDAAQRKKDEHARRRAEAESHPMTKKVLKTFGATIKEIKVHG
jgi:hypothetical protein